MPLMRDALNAFFDVPEAVAANAGTGPLAGLSLGVKDIFDVAGIVTGCGNPDRAAGSRPAGKTAPAVQKLLDAGARFAGKTQTDEFAFSLMGQNAHFPFPINPKAPGRVTGGSSSGSAAAVAGGLVDIATGSDTGGSIRAPASFCGLVGLRTTQGTISLEGAMPLAPSLDTFGWFARDMAVYERVAGVMLGSKVSPPLRGRWPEGPEVRGEVRDPKGASRQAERTPPGGSAATCRGESPASPVLRTPSRGRETPLRLAELDELVLGDAEAAEYRRMASVVANVLGEPTTAPPLAHSTDDLYWAFRRIQAREAWAAHGGWIAAHPGSMSKAVEERFAFGATISAAQAQADDALRTDFRHALGDLLGDDGVLVMPTVPGAAPRIDSTADQLQAYRERALRLLCWSGLSGFPQITLPLGAVDGAPFGISLLGPAGGDMDLIGMGRHLLETQGQA